MVKRHPPGGKLHTKKIIMLNFSDAHVTVVYLDGASVIYVFSHRHGGGWLLVWHLAFGWDLIWWNDTSPIGDRQILRGDVTRCYMP